MPGSNQNEELEEKAHLEAQSVIMGLQDDSPMPLNS
jgi:hypothetical protein